MFFVSDCKYGAKLHGESIIQAKLYNGTYWSAWASLVCSRRSGPLGAYNHFTFPRLIPDFGWNQMIKWLTVLMCCTISELNSQVVHTEHSSRCQCRLWNIQSPSVLSTSQVQIISTSKYLHKIVHSNGRWGWLLEKLFIQICVYCHVIPLSTVRHIIIQTAAFSLRWEIPFDAKNSECFTS